MFTVYNFSYDKAWIVGTELQTSIRSKRYDGWSHFSKRVSLRDLSTTTHTPHLHPKLSGPPKVLRKIRWILHKKSKISPAPLCFVFISNLFLNYHSSFVFSNWVLSYSVISCYFLCTFLRVALTSIKILAYRIIKCKIQNILLKFLCFHGFLKIRSVIVE